MKLLDTAGVSTLWGKVKDHVKTSIDSQQFKTINGTSVKGAGDIHIDLTLYKVVSSLPTSDIDTTKIYLVKDSSVDGNLYSEYMYVDEKWEKLGNFRSSVDLEPYAKKSEAVNNLKVETQPAGEGSERQYIGIYNADNKDNKAGEISILEATTNMSGFMSYSDKEKLDSIEYGAASYSLPLAADGTRGGIQVGYTANGRNYPVQLSGEKAYVNVPWTDTNTTYSLATSTNDGIMSASDKSKLDLFGTSKVTSSIDVAKLLTVDYNGIAMNRKESSLTVVFNTLDKSSSSLNFTAASPHIAGLMSGADKTKLDSITTITDTELKSILV